MSASKKTAPAAAPEPAAKILGGLDADEEAAKSVMALNRWIETVEDGGRRAVGTWLYVPDAYRHWHFVRCGLQSSPAAVNLARELMNMGYRKAPQGVQLAGFDRDGTHGIYVCAPPETHDKITKMKQARKRKRHELLRSTLNGGATSLDNMRGVSVEHVDSRTTRMSAEDFRRLR